MVARRVSLSISSCLAALLLGGCSHHLGEAPQFRVRDDARGPAELMPLPASERQARGPRADFTDIGYATWTEDEPSYRIFPGDEIEVTVPSAPELSKTQIVPPDGRLTLPLIAPVMAADKEIPQLQAALTQAYSSQLLRPQVNVSIKTAGPLKVYVGGEVNNPGMYDMAGDGDALRAVIQAGGFKNTGAQNQVVVIRRSGDGHPMMRTSNLSGGLRGRGPVSSDLVPLRRFDIVYVPRTSAAEAAQFVQTYFRDLSPIQFGFTIPLAQ
jgi:protein involved in polysaccharide export with SLBB domain